MQEPARVASCARCQERLKPVSDEPLRRKTDWTKQYWDALPITLSGGYGMFYDEPASVAEQTVILCKSCADELLKREPWLKQAIPYRVIA